MLVSFRTDLPRALGASHFTAWLAVFLLACFFLGARAAAESLNTPSGRLDASMAYVEGQVRANTR
ncbi:MAG TPA: hypothetical protein VIM46_02620, partial [Luteolibacter sp.]